MAGTNEIKGAGMFKRGESVMVSTRGWGVCRGTVESTEVSRCGTFALYSVNIVYGQYSDGSDRTHIVTESWYKLGAA